MNSRCWEYTVATWIDVLLETAQLIFHIFCYVFRDANKKRPEDPDYDPRTLYVPDSFLSKQTPVSVHCRDLFYENFCLKILSHFAHLSLLLLLMYWHLCSLVELLVDCLSSQQQASASQGQICSDKFTCCHTEVEAADKTFYLTQSQYADTGLTCSSTDALQGSHLSANV